MANIIGIQTVDNVLIISVDANPITGGGTDAPIGSIALAADGSGVYYKTAAGNTNWINISKDQFHQTASSSVAGIVETTLLGTGVGSKTIPANTLNVGDTIYVKLQGFYTRTAGNITFRSKIAGNIQATSALTSAAATNGSFWIDIQITIRTIGAAGTAISQGKVTNYDNGGEQVGLPRSFTPQTVAFAINTTVDNTYDLTAQWSAVGAVNSITTTNFSITKKSAAV